MFSFATKTRARFASSSSRSIGRVLSAVALTFALTASTTACGGDDKKDGTGPGALSGTYSLKSVENVAPPVKIWEGVIEGHDVEFQVRSGAVTLNADGSYTTSIVLRTVVDNEFEDETISASGTYTRNGSSITFKDEGDDLVGQINDGALSVELDLLELGETVTFTYRK